MRVGLLTGGGDVPGLNAAIRAVVKRGEGEYGHSIIGFRNGWRGVVDGFSLPLTPPAHPQPARRRRDAARHRALPPARRPTAASTRCCPRSSRSASRRSSASAATARCTPRARWPRRASASSRSRRRSTTTSGAPTSRSASTPPSRIATEAIDRIHTTAESHNRVMIVEVMGRHAGWIAADVGHRRGSRDRARPRAAVRHRQDRAVPQAPPPRARELLDHRRRRGRRARGGHVDALRDAAGQVRRHRRRAPSASG